jgi:DNA recombination protein RmuC
VALLEQAQRKLTDAFKALASEALNTNNQSFLELAKTHFALIQKEAQGDLEKRQQSIDELVKPVKESLLKVDTKIQELEKAREGAYQALRAQVGSLIETQQQLRSETNKLVGALGTPSVRGRWGEIQLQRVVELAGMLEHCDFHSQQSVTTDDGRLRPDLIVRLPGGKNIVVDAKAPLGAYLEALEAPDDDGFKQKMKHHSAQVRAHMVALCRKNYWEQFQPAPEFVVLFLPGEIFFSAALQHDPSLIENGVEQRVIIATPTTLIALLRAVNYGWQQDSVAKSAIEISNLGKELYKRLATMSGHMIKLGSGLDAAVLNYNKAIGSIETQVLTQARRFRDLKSAPEDVDIPELAPIEVTTRILTKPELLIGLEDQRPFDLDSETDSPP